MKSHVGVAALAAALLAAVPSAAQPAPRKLDTALLDARTSGCATAQVIISTKKGHRGGVSTALRRHGHEVVAEFPSIDAISARVACDDLAALAGLDSVLSVSHDAVVRPSGLASMPAPEGGRFGRASADGDDGGFGESSDIRTLSGYRSVGVAVIDSGIHPAADFGHRITHFYDFTSGLARRTHPNDPYGHGTHVAGLIAGTFVGVAPDLRLVGLKVLDSQGRGRTTSVIRALEFATANREALGIRAISLSLGHPIYEPASTDPLVQAVEGAVRAGLVVIASAGNLGINPATGEPGYAGVFSPANAPSALTVGALQTFDTWARSDDRVAPYSSRGPSWFDAFAKPDVVAPGHNMLSIAAPGSTLRREFEQRGGTGEYMRLSGTSMAAGVASGLVGLMLEANPHLTPNAIKMALQFSAIPVKDASGAEYDVLAQGAGSINRSGAVQLALAMDATRPAGDKWLTFGMPFETRIAGETHAWSRSMIWGPHRVLGSGIVDENRPAWATGVVWGDGLNDDNIPWGAARLEGDNIVWGTAFDAGDDIVWGTNFIWSDAFEDNIVWGTSFEDDNIVWGSNVVWGSSLLGIRDGDNIVWGTAADEDNIVWGTMTDDNIVWGTFLDDNIVWGTFRDADDNIVWGTYLLADDNIVWGTLHYVDDNIVWGTFRDMDDNIVWGTSVIWGDGLVRETRGNAGAGR